MTSVTDLLPASCFDELDEWAGNDEVKGGVVQILKQVKELCESRAKKIQEENKKLKEEIKEYEFESCESLISTQKLYGQAFAIQSERDALREENKKLKELVGSIKKETDKAK